jgi:hypothetical protein
LASNDHIGEQGGFRIRKGSGDSSAGDDVGWHELLPAQPTEVVDVRDLQPPPPDGDSVAGPRFDVTDVCVANCDTLSAALAVGDAAALNFANAHTPGGRYRSGGRAQEEDLCRLLPQLYPALLGAAAAGARGCGANDPQLHKYKLMLRAGVAAAGVQEKMLLEGMGAAQVGHVLESLAAAGDDRADSGGDSSAATCDPGHPESPPRAYPIVPGTALLTRNLAAVRRAGTYELCASAGECTIVTAAAPCGVADRRPKGGWAGSEWAVDVALRVRAVLHAARRSGHPHLVLGAFGCGAFGNPAGPVAAVFREQLEADEFRGAFSCVVFAIIDPLGTGNLAPFRKELASIGQH